MKLMNLIDASMKFRAIYSFETGWAKHKNRRQTIYTFEKVIPANPSLDSFGCHGSDGQPYFLSNVLDITKILPSNCFR
jgi:hypothetical protein